MSVDPSHERGPLQQYAALFQEVIEAKGHKWLYLNALNQMVALEKNAVKEEHSKLNLETIIQIVEDDLWQSPPEEAQKFLSSMLKKLIVVQQKAQDRKDPVTRIQRLYRKHLTQKKLRPTTEQARQQPLHEQKISEEKVKQILEKATPEERALLERLLKEGFIKRISFKKFEKALHETFHDALSTIMSFPKDQRGYVIIYQEGKSAEWVSRQLLANSTSIAPPSGCIPGYELGQFLSEHPEVRHVVFADDASYSGEQAERVVKNVLRDTKEMNPPLHVHVAIPFMTKLAWERVAVLDPSLHIAKHQLLARVSDLPITKEELDLFLQWCQKYGEFDADTDAFLQTHSLSYFEHKAPDRISTFQVLQDIVPTIPVPYREMRAVVLALEKEPKNERFAIVETEKGTFVFAKMEGVSVLREGKKIAVPQEFALRLLPGDKIE